MLLTVDCGNTNIVFALYDGYEQRANWRISTDAKRSGDEYFVWLTQLMMLRNIDIAAVKDIIIASVVPEVQPKLVNLAIRGFNLRPMVVGAANVKLGIDVRIDRPDQAGADRLVNAVAAHHCYDLPAIVLDFGTATTLDLIGAGGTYEGGIIAPGVSLSIEALERAAAQLPRLELRPFGADLPVLGKNTVAAMETGVFWGYVGMIEGLLRRLRDEQGGGKDIPAIATGGLAGLFAEHLSGITAVDPDLTVRGLFELYARNRGLRGDKGN